MAKELTLEETVRRRIEKKLKARSELRIHAMAFVSANIGIWLFWVFLNMSFPFPMIITFGWMIGLFAHYLDYSSKHGTIYQNREALIAREIEKERARSYDITSEKAKNDFSDDGNILLTEDGELSDSIIQELEENVTNAGRRNR
ncbi:MAG: 2TM domain-containing protein [Anaerolineae bacterium]|jgi:hypothetical protein|nr:2TM domain-containing protein [Anaerolineae bacterium]